MIRVLVAVAAAGLALTACATAVNPPATTPGLDDAGALFGHVHGLGVDPADGAVYVATHHGLFRISSPGRLDPIGPTRRDFMGFTIAGPHTFLSSGHPAPDEKTPNPLGLVESRDAGSSWTTLSLSGEVDFHALDVIGSTIYGYDGQLRASTDGGRSWQSRAVIAATDIAAHPRRPDTVVAATPSGVAVSTDGGHTFGVAHGPPLALLTWALQDTLYGLAPEGTLQTSTDATVWTVATTVSGRPQALAATSDGRILIATDQGIFDYRPSTRSITKLI